MKKFWITCVSLGLLVSCQSSPVTSLPSSAMAPSLQRMSAPQTARAPLFPTQAGYTWNYDVTMSPVMDPLVEYKGTYDLSIERSNPQTGALEMRAFNSFTTRYNFPTLVQSPQGIQLKDMTFLGHGAEQVRGLSIDFVKLPLQTGARWEDPNWIGKYKGQEKVVVPAGTFQAHRIEVIGTFDHAYTAVGDYWLVPGKGIVKSTLTVPNWHIETVLGFSGLKR